PGFQEMDRETVTKYMWGEGFGETGATASAMTGLFDGGPCERVVWSIAGKQPGGGSAQAPPVPQDLEQFRREHHIPIPLALALLNADHHALTVEIAWAEPDRFRDPESGGVARREDGAVL